MSTYTKTGGPIIPLIAGRFEPLANKIDIQAGVSADGLSIPFIGFGVSDSSGDTVFATIFRQTLLPARNPNPAEPEPKGR